MEQKGFREPLDGFAGIRWSDSRDAIAARFAGRVHETSSYEGRDPRTGQRITRGPGLLVEDLPEVSRAIRLSTSIDFDGAGVQEFEISALPPADSDSWGEAEWSQLSERAAAAIRDLARRLRLGDPSMELQEQTWTVDRARIKLAIDTGPDDFVLFIHRPTTPTRQ